ncbi:hypothetical protein HB364_02065 [Pseudoflavitalea sp. X16]|uniref:hypothetical protein n=1 Tax=Paraflavitalea devenefica TaxID=2716334 RepID=UPI00142305FC|nr:hypothetical protein [Paraflavitalea devenefica]NII23847.1 hypothetical protein [Paraflavitalea devenefica]
MKWLVVAGFAVLSFTGYVACRHMKVQHGTPVIRKNLVKWESKGDATASAQLTKDEQGRITGIENDTEINTFRYWSDSLMLLEHAKPETRVVYEFKGKLDNMGRLLSGVAIAAYADYNPDTVYHRFEYNATGGLVKEFRDYGKDGIYIITYEYKNGDVVKICTWYNNELYNTKELEYYADKKNLTGLEDFKFRKNINNLVGNTSRHLVKKITSVARGGKINYSFNYEYETDMEGLPVKLITKKGKKVSTVTTYFYEAKT